MALRHLYPNLGFSGWIVEGGKCRQVFAGIHGCSYSTAYFVYYWLQWLEICLRLKGSKDGSDSAIHLTIFSFCISKRFPQMKGHANCQPFRQGDKKSGKPQIWGEYEPFCTEKTTLAEQQPTDKWQTAELSAECTSYVESSISWFTCKGVWWDNFFRDMPKLKAGKKVLISWWNYEKMAENYAFLLWSI